MPRYVVERTFQEPLEIPLDDSGVSLCSRVIGVNAEAGVTWVHSYVTIDKRKTFCIYDAPDADAIKRTAERNGLPLDRVSEVRVLDPYFYR